MRLYYRTICAALSAGLLPAVVCLALPARQAVAVAAVAAATTEPQPAIPGAPIPQLQGAALDLPQDQAPRNPQPAAGSAAPAGSSSSSQAGQQPTAPPQASAPRQSQHDTARKQLKAEEHQRMLGVVPNFTTTYIGNAASLSAGQKMQLAFRSAIDPFTFAVGFLVAGVNEGLDNDSGFGWGPKGYFKRAGAAYLDAFDGDMIASGILPALLRQDPRYFRLGHGGFRHRLFYSLAASFICKHDNTGRWEPNYSNVGGNFAAGAISNLYYPSKESGWGQTLGNGMIVTSEGMAGGVFQEFWPDISRKFLHRDPTGGLDAQTAAADQARKKARR